MDDGVGPAAIGRLIQPMLNSEALLTGACPPPPKVGKRPTGAGWDTASPAPPDQAGQKTSLDLSDWLRWRAFQAPFNCP